MREVHEDLNGLGSRVSDIEKHLDKLLYIQERTTNNIEALSKDIKALIERDGDFKVLENKVDALHDRLDKQEKNIAYVVKSMITTVITVVATGIGYAFLDHGGK